MDERGVTFRWKDYRAKGKTRYKAMTLSAEEFMRRFLLHVLPGGFHRIRHYGLLANGSRRLRPRRGAAVARGTCRCQALHRGHSRSERRAAVRCSHLRAAATAARPMLIVRLLAPRACHPRATTGCREMIICTLINIRRPTPDGWTRRVRTRPRSLAAMRPTCRGRRTSPSAYRASPQQRTSGSRPLIGATQQPIAIAQCLRQPLRHAPRFPPSRLVRHLPSGRCRSNACRVHGQVSDNP